MTRKYRQQGYQDGDRQEKSRKPQQRPKEREGPRGIPPAKAKVSTKCSRCAHVLTLLREANVLDTCPNCGTDIRSCANCRYFDSRAPRECRKPIKQRITPKDRGNSCTFFEVKQTVEMTRETTSARKARDGKQAFDDLFRNI